jgi:hypothetical protein
VLIGSSEGVFLWENGNLQPIASPSGGINLDLGGLNSVGQVVGTHDGLGSNVIPFRWERGHLTDLGKLAPEQPTFPKSSNSSGIVVGYAGSMLDDTRAIRYANDQIQDLNSLIQPATGIVLISAISVNDRNEILATGRVSGRSGYLLLTPE